MNKWEEMRNIIQELHDNNENKPDVFSATQFLLNIMKVIEKKDYSSPSGDYNITTCDHCK